MQLSSWRSRTVSLIGIMFVVLSPGAASEPGPLELVGRAGKTYGQPTVRERRIWVTEPGGTAQPAPVGIRWELRGVLLEAVNLIHLCPDYSIRTRGRVPMNGAARTQTFAIVRIPTGIGAWPDNVLNDALAIVAWIVDGQPAWVAAQPGVLVNAEQPFACMVVRELSGDEVRGHPIILLLKDGRFLPPKPTFSNSSDNGVLAKVILSTEDDAVREINEQMDVGSRSKSLRATLLHFAAQAGHVAAVTAMVDREPVLDRSDNYGRSALAWAAANGRGAAVRVLLRALEASERRPRFHRDAYDVALHHGHLEIASLLAGDDRSRLERVVERAARQADVSVLEELLHRGGTRFRPKIDAENVSAALLAGDPHLVRTLLAAGVPPNGRWEGWPFLVLAALSGRAESIDVLLAQGAKIDATGPHGVTPLMAAALSGDAAGVERLLQAGCDPYATDKAGVTASEVARLSGRQEVLARLREVRAEPRPETPKLQTVEELRWWGEPCLGRFGENVLSEYEVDVPAIMLPDEQGHKVAALFEDHRSITARTMAAPFSPMDRAGTDSLLKARAAQCWLAASVIVEPDGAPSAVSIITGAFDPSPEIAARAIRQLRFTPATHMGRAVRTRATVVITGASIDVLRGVDAF